MKKTFFTLLIFSMFALPAWAVAFNTEAEQTQKVAELALEMLGGSKYEALIRQKHPEAAIKWSSRVWAFDPNSATYLVSCELNEKKKNPRFVYYELSVTIVNENPELLKKYGIVTKK